MENSEEQTKTRAVVDIIKDWEKIAGQLSTDGDANLWNENSDSWRKPYAVSHIIRNSLSYAYDCCWRKENETEACQSLLARRALVHYEQMLKHQLTTLEEYRDQALELMSGGTDGK